MVANPYAPPKAPVADVSAGSGKPMFFPVSLVKLTVMSLCTLGLYQLYWFYKNFKSIKLRDSSDIFPFWRAFFGVLFCYSLFKRIREDGVERGLVPGPVAGALASGWIIAAILWRLPDPYWLITFASVLFQLPIQHYVNRLNSEVAPGHDPNSRFGAWNVVAVVFGVLLFALMAIGLLYSDPVTTTLPR